MSISSWAEERVIDWQNKVRLSPENSLNYFNLAVAYHKKGKLKRAMKYYRKTIQMKSRLAPVCFLYMARIYRSKDKVEKALDLLSEIDLEKSPPRFKKRVEFLIVELLSESAKDQEHEDQEKRWDIYWDIALGSNSNPSFVESGAETDLQYQTDIYLSLKLLEGQRYQLSSSYGFNSVSYLEQPNSNTTYHEVSLPFSYYWSHSRLQWTPQFLVDTYDGDEFSYNPGMSLDWTMKRQEHYWGAYYQYTKASVIDSESSYLNGETHQAKLHWSRYRKTDRWSVNLNYGDFKYDDTDDIISTYQSPGFSVKRTYYWKNWDFSFYGAFEKRQYTADTDFFVRKDEKRQGAISLGYVFSQWFRGYLSATHIKNQSNENENKYEQNIFLIGLSGGY